MITTTDSASARGEILPLSTALLSAKIADPHPAQPWVLRAGLLWQRRRRLAAVTGISLLVSLAIACAIPKQYESVTRIMPPDQGGAGGLLLAALAGRGGGLGSLASGFLTDRTSTSALFISLLRSGTITGHLIDRFQLQQVYNKRYRVDTAKKLVRRTTISDDKKSGVISIAVQDHDPVRARDLAQAYLEELNKLVTRTNTSAAHQERIFIERRLQSVQSDLETAQVALGEFSSRNSTVDLKEQARAMVDAAAKVQGELLIEQSGLESLRQIYGDGNIRVREVQARIGTLQHELDKMSGSSAPSFAPGTTPTGTDATQDYPALRQLPRLAVPYADLYRRVKVQETVFELLTQQYELARINEAKDVPVVSVIDPPGIPEKKAFPPRLVLTLLGTVLSFVAASTVLLLQARWAEVDPADPRKLLANDVLLKLRHGISRLPLLHRGRP